MPPDPICPICDEAVAARIPVVFDHGLVAHLECYIATEGAATLVRGFLESRPGERFCYTCLARHLTRDRQEIEKAATGLRLTRSVVVAPGLCSACTYARATIRLKQVAAPRPA